MFLPRMEMYSNGKIISTSVLVQLQTADGEEGIVRVTKEKGLSTLTKVHL